MKIFKTLILFLICTAMLISAQDNVVVKKFKTGKNPKIIFNDIDGNLFFNTENTDQISVKFKKSYTGNPSEKQLKYFNAIKPEIKFTDNKLTVRVLYPKRSGFFNFFSGFNMKISTHISAPVKSAIKANLVDGNCTVNKLEGKARISCTDGNIVMQEIKGRIFLRTVDGNIKVTGYTGKADLKTTDGNIVISGNINGLTTSSVDGNVSANFLNTDKAPSYIKASCTDGNISITIPEKLAQNIDARTCDGTVSLRGTVPGRIIKKKSNRLLTEDKNSQLTINLSATDGNIVLKTK